jgi:arylsulfatase A-like enzyme
VIYIIFDGVGTRFWSFYNPDSGLTPFMKDAAEKDFIVFDNMFTLGDKTRISTSGLFTSVLPFKTGHGINRNYIPERNKEQFYASVRSGEIASLPDVFRRRGYVTEQFGNSGFTVHLLTTGIDYGFSRSYEFSVNPYNNFGISRSFFEFLRKNRDREFFTYIHYNTTHKPYYMPAGHFLKGILNAPAGALWRPAYVGCVSYADDVFRNIYAALKEQGLLENTIIVVATDHGSGFDFSKYNLGNQYNDYTRMTFMMHLPEKRKREAVPGRKRIGTFLSSINTAPTLVELAGLPGEKAFAGRSFSSMFRDGSEKNFFDREIWSFGRKTASLITEDMQKYIIRHTDSENQIERRYIFFGEQEEVLPEELYDLKADPSESRNLFTARRDLLRSFRLKYLALDIHHPERTVLTFVPADGKAHRMEIVIDTPTEITGADLYSPDLKVFSKNLRKEGDGGRYRFSFAVGKDPLHLIFDLKNDRAPLLMKILEDGRPVPRGKILATDLNISLFDNPVLLKEKNDFLLLNGISLPGTDEIIKGRTGLIVKLSRIDLHRWIDIGRLESRGISAGMKETLKSWGYIQ